MMKRLMLLMLAACCLMAAAHAQTVPEQVAAPLHAQSTWYSPTGRTTISLDAQVLVPDVDSMPVVEVFPRIFAPEEVHALADALIGPGAWQAYTDQGKYGQRTDNSPQPGYRRADASLSYMTRYELSLGGGGAWVYDLPYKMVSASYYEQGGSDTPKVLVRLQYFFKPGDNLGRNVGRQEDAVALAANVVTSIWPDMQIHSVDKDLDIFIERTSWEGKPADYGYRIYFARLLHGVVATPVSQQGAEDANYFFLGRQQPGYHLPLPYERLFVDVGEDGIFQLIYDNPLRIGQTLEDNPALLPFDQVLDILAKVSPLKYAAYEHAKNNGIQINRVVLGYMSLQMKDYPGRYQMVPVWDFFGTRTIDQEFYDFTNYSLFTINAMDGTVIDRDYGY